jgi:hypothetical protein
MGILMRCHGRQQFTQLCLVISMSLWLGCDEVRRAPLAQLEPPSSDAGSRFDRASSGTIRGRVTWEGEIPDAPALGIYPNPLAGEPLKEKQDRPNPNSPAIDPRTRGVGHAIVFLHGVDPPRGKPWDQSLVRVEQRGGQFHLRQDGTDSAFGVVRRGDPVALVSRDNYFHSLHAGGAAFFTVAFPEPDQPLERRFQEKGIVELTSSAGYYWMRAYLFVDDHPYYARTQSDGRFQLTEVPPGQYELVCWMPNWRAARQERDPESGLMTRWFFARPGQHVVPIVVEPNKTCDVDLKASGKLFLP